MAERRFPWCRAAETQIEKALTLSEKGRPHLEDRVGESGLEDRTGDRRPHGLASGVDLLPRLLGADTGHGGTGEHLDPLGILRTEANSTVHSDRLELPGVLVSGVDAL